MVDSHPADDLIDGDSRLTSGDLSGAFAAYNRASTTGHNSAAVAWRLGRAHQIQGEVGAALDAYDVEPSATDAVHDTVQLFAWRSTAHFLHGDHASCRRDAQRAADLLEQVSDDSARAVTFTALAMLAALDGDRRLNEVHYNSALHYAVAAGDVLQQLRIRANRGSRHLEEGDYSAAVRELDEALSVPTRRSFPTIEALTLTNRAESLLRLGRLDEAVADLDQARALFQSTGSRMIAYTLAMLGEVYRVRGDTALARLAYEEALRSGREAEDVQSSVRALSGLALLLVREDPHQALNWLTLAKGLGATLSSARLSLAACLVAQSLGDTVGAQEQVRTAAILARRHRDRPSLAEALELEALLDDTSAPPLLEQALIVWQSIGDPIGEARTRLRLASVTPRPQAVLLIAAAEEQLGALGARELVAQAAALRSRLDSSASSTIIHCLGAFQVLRDGLPVPTAEWGSRKPRDLLKLLISARGRPVAREQLIDALWPGEDPEACAGRLSVALSGLRRVLNAGREVGRAETVLVERQALRIDTAAATIDVEQFLALAEAGRRDLALGRTEAVTALSSAEVLYRGEYLAEDRYADWAEPLRDQARETYVAVLRNMADLAWSQGDSDGALRRYLRLLEIDGYDEDAHLGLVRALIRSRRHGEARRRYEFYTRSMEELDLPSEPFPI